MLVAHLGAIGFYGFADAGVFVAGQIVHHVDIASSQVLFLFLLFFFSFFFSSFFPFFSLSLLSSLLSLFFFFFFLPFSSLLPFSFSSSLSLPFSLLSFLSFLFFLFLFSLLSLLFPLFSLFLLLFLSPLFFLFSFLSSLFFSFLSLPFLLSFLSSLPGIFMPSLRFGPPPFAYRFFAFFVSYQPCFHLSTGSATRAFPSTPHTRSLILNYPTPHIPPQCSRHSEYSSRPRIFPPCRLNRISTMPISISDRWESFELVSRRSIDPTGWRGVHRRERNVCRVTPGHIARRGAIVEDDPRYTRSEVNDPTTKVCAVGCFAMRRAAHGEQSKRPLSGAAVNYAFTSRRPVRVIRDV